MPSREFDYTKRFLRSYDRYTGRDKKRKACVENTLEALRSNPYDDALKTHPLKGELKGLLACSCGYDCRIIFTVHTDKKTSVEIITLFNVGTHDEVY